MIHTHTHKRTVALLILLASLAACSSSDDPTGTQDAGADAGAAETIGQHRLDASTDTAIDVDAEPGEMRTFSEWYRRFGATSALGHYVPPQDIAAVVDPMRLILYGRTIRLEEGRREPGGDGISPSNYRQHLNVLIGIAEIIRDLPDSPLGDKVVIEFSWPHNVDMDEIIAAFPRNIGVIVMSEALDNGAPAAVFEAWPHSLIFKMEDGSTLLPFHPDEQQFHEIFVSRTEAMDYEETLVAIKAAL